MTTANNASAGRKVAQTASTAGNVQDGNLSLTSSLANPVFVAPGVTQEAGMESLEEEAPGAGTDKVTTTAQPSDKDTRHAATKINDEIDKRFKLSQRMVERDPDAIYDIAETDPDMAERLLKNIPDYGASSVEELLENRDLKGQDLKAVKQKVSTTSSEVRKLQEQLQEERILRLQEKNPDLTGDVEAEFRKMYSDERFSDKTPDQLLNIARALTGNATPTIKNGATDVALEMLKQNEGVQTTVRGASANQKITHETDHQRATRMAFGNTEEDFKKYLPENIDDMLRL